MHSTRDCANWIFPLLWYAHAQWASERERERKRGTRTHVEIGRTNAEMAICFHLSILWPVNFISPKTWHICCIVKWCCCSTFNGNFFITNLNGWMNEPSVCMCACVLSTTTMCEITKWQNLCKKNDAMMMKMKMMTNIQLNCIEQWAMSI